MILQPNGDFFFLFQDSNSDNLGKQFANKDAVHVLTYSIMMLNTDLHSNQVKKKMTLEVCNVNALVQYVHLRW